MLKEAMVKLPGMPEPLWLLSLMAFYGIRYSEAISWASMGTAVGCFKGSCSGKGRKGYRDAATWYDLPYEQLYFAYTGLGNAAAAEEADNDTKAAGEVRSRILEDPILILYQSTGEYELSWSEAQIETEVSLSCHGAKPKFKLR